MKTMSFEPADEAEAIKGKHFSFQEDLFCIAYTGRAMYNATRAAKLAGYSPKYCSDRAYKLLAKPHICKRIELLQKELSHELLMAPDDIFAEWGAIIRADIRNFLNNDGSHIELHELDDISARAIASLTILVYEEDGSQRHVITNLKLCDKNTALHNYAKAQNIFTGTPDVISKNKANNKTAVPHGTQPKVDQLM